MCFVGLLTPEPGGDDRQIRLENQIMGISRIPARQSNDGEIGRLAGLETSRFIRPHPSASAPLNVAICNSPAAGKSGYRERTNRASPRMLKFGLDARLSVPERNTNAASEELSK